MKVVKLTKQYADRVSHFSSGNEFIDNYIRSGLAISYADPLTYILLSDTDEIIGYYSISANALNDTSNFKIGGAIHIDKFAIIEEYQKHTLRILSDGTHYHVSDFLLDDCIDKAFSMKNNLGVSFITLSSTNEGLNLYRRNGFDIIEEDMSFSSGEKENSCIDMYFALDMEYI